MSAELNLRKAKISPNLWLLVALILTLASPLLAIGFGSVDLSAKEVLSALCSLWSDECSGDAIKERIVLDLRMPRIILAFLCGAGLALSGAVLQTVTRNPLADPYLFGIASGASFGAVLVIAAVGVGTSGLGQFGISAGAFAGSAASVLLVLSLAGVSMQIERMLLAGVAVSFMFSAGTSLVLYSSDPQAAASLLFWTLGSFNAATWERLGLPALVIVICLILFLGYARVLRAVLAGEENAIALGVDVRKLRLSMLLLSSLLTATLVASCGGIGFVGLMVPHIVRRLMRQQARYVFVGCLLFGGVFMVWVDVLARTLLDHNELPIGVITAALGSVFFLFVLRRRGSFH